MDNRSAARLHEDDTHTVSTGATGVTAATTATTGATAAATVSWAIIHESAPL